MLHHFTIEIAIQVLYFVSNQLTQFSQFHHNYGYHTRLPTFQLFTICGTTGPVFRNGTPTPVF